MANTTPAAAVGAATARTTTTTSHVRSRKSLLIVQPPGLDRKSASESHRGSVGAPQGVHPEFLLSRRSPVDYKDSMRAESRTSEDPSLLVDRDPSWPASPRRWRQHGTEKGPSWWSRARPARGRAPSWRSPSSGRGRSTSPFAPDAAPSSNRSCRSASSGSSSRCRCDRRRRPSRERLLSGAAAAASGLFEDAPIDHTSRGDGGFATLHGLYWVAAGIAAGLPLVLTVDDAHWVDEPTLRALSFLAGRIADVPIVLVITLRSNEPSRVAEVLANLESNPSARGGWISRRSGPRLSPRSCGGCSPRLTTSCAGPSTSPVPVTRCTSANCCAASRATARLRRSPRFGRLRRLRWPNKSCAAWPRSVRARPDWRRRCRRWARAAGSATPPKSPGRTSTTRPRRRAMRRVEILGTEDPFEWIHPIVQRSIHDVLTVTERDALHARAAEVLAQAGAPLGVVASHLSALRPAGSASVVAGLLAAADEALTKDAPDVAATLLRRALDEDADEPPRATLLLELGQVEVSRRNPAATAVLEEALDVSVDARVRALAALGADGELHLRGPLGRGGGRH